MNPKIRIFLLCPVPEDQKPVVQYVQLKENENVKFFLSLIFSFFSFFKFKKRFQLKNLFFSSFFILVMLIILFSFFSFPYLRFENFSPFFLFFLFLIFSISFILFFRWKQIENNFKKAMIEYEESSWYDTEVWEKPFSLLKNDNLLYAQKIKPIVRKIFFLFVFSFFSSFIFLFSISVR